MASFERINYVLRPNKQVERKMIIDILMRLDLDISLTHYTYIGMGSIYYYDFILFHKYFGITSMVSIDNDPSEKRFLFNKPYDFVNFENCDTSQYLYRHNYKKDSIFWLDYDWGILDNGYLLKDIGIIGRNCIKNSFFLLTVNCEPPSDPAEMKRFMKEFDSYIKPALKDIKNMASEKFPSLVQHIFLNLIADSCLYNKNKFVKCFSYIYRDGALMYTLGGIFTDDVVGFLNKYDQQNLIQSNPDSIIKIQVPNITYKEKFYLDSNIQSIELLLQYSKEYLENICITKKEFNTKMKKYLEQELDVELKYSDVQNYVSNYRFISQYYEGII